MDQRRSRWDTHEELLDYCRHSATPVGEMVLGVLGYRDPWRIGHERRHLHRPAARQLLAGHRAATCATATASTCRARTMDALRA